MTHLPPSVSGTISSPSATSLLTFYDRPVANHIYQPIRARSATSILTNQPLRYQAHVQLRISLRNKERAGPLMASTPTMLAPPSSTIAIEFFLYRQQTQREMQQPSTGSQQPLNIHKSQPKLTSNKPQKTYYTYCHNVTPLQHLPSARL